MIDFKTSKTKENLLKAFAGESQARNRYTFAAEVAKTEGYPILHDLFIYTTKLREQQPCQIPAYPSTSPRKERIPLTSFHPGLREV